MAERILFPEFRKQNESTKYPFSGRSTMTNNEGLVILDGAILDASLYPVGGGADMYLSSVVVDHQQITFTIGDINTPTLASGSFDVINPPNNFTLQDNLGRPAGLIVSESNRLSLFQAFGIGTHAFTADEAAFCATVCLPTPELGVRAIVLDDGSILTGDVWLVGDEGVVIREDATIVDPAPGDIPQKVIRVDVVGDTLFRRRLCTPTNLFGTPKLITKIRVKDDKQEFTCLPDDAGNFEILVNNALAFDTVLRVRSTPDGPVLEAVGSPIG